MAYTAPVRLSILLSLVNDPETWIPLLGFQVSTMASDLTTSYMSLFDDTIRTSSSEKSRDKIFRRPNLTFSAPMLHLKIFSLKLWARLVTLLVTSLTYWWQCDGHSHKPSQVHLEFVYMGMELVHCSTARMKTTFLLLNLQILNLRFN